jgi:hypothetical protein
MSGVKNDHLFQVDLSTGISNPVLKKNIIILLITR